MNIADIKRYFLLLSFILIMVVIGFTGGLNLSSFHQNYRDTLMANYSTIAGDTIRNIEYAVRYGKPLEHFYGIEQLLQKNTDWMPEIEEVQVILPDGRVIYNQTGMVHDQQYSGTILEALGAPPADKGKTYTFAQENGKYYLFLPIHDKQEQRIGSLGLIFDESVVSNKSQGYLMELILYLLALALLSLVLLIVIFPKVYNVSAGEKGKKNVLITLFIVLSIVQIVAGCLNYVIFHEAHRESEIETTERLAHFIQQNISKVTQAGVPVEELYGLDDYLRHITDAVPSLEQIVITNPQGEALYASFQATVTPKAPSLTVPLGVDAKGNLLSIGITISEEYLNAKMRTIILDTLTVMVTSILFMIEITLFFFVFLRRKLAKAAGGSEQAESAEEIHRLQLIRPLTFLLSIGIFLSTSFIPLVMKRLYEPLWGLSETVILALPTSAEMLCAGLATIPAGRQISRKGWKPAFQTSLLLLVAGMLLSAYTRDMFLFILARGIAGSGYGYMMMAMRSYINTRPSEQERSAGVSAFYAGLYAGMNCAVVAGAMLADRIGFSAVFYTAAVIVLGVLVLSHVTTTNQPIVQNERAAQVKSHKPLSAFWFNGKILAFFAFILLPTTACGMFLDYYFPVFAESIGVSSSNVGRAFLLNGLCVVYLGPILSRWSEKHLGVKQSVVLSSAIMGAALLIFSLQGTLFAAMIAVLLLGIADSFGIVAHNNYYMRLVAHTRIGVGRAIGYYDNVRKLGQMLGPMVFGGFAVFGFLGIGVIGGILLAAILLFLITSREKREHSHDHGIPF